MASLPTKQTFGGKPKPVAVLAGVTGGWYPPPAGYMLHASGPCWALSLCGGPARGELSGGKWIACVAIVWARARDRYPLGL